MKKLLKKFKKFLIEGALADYNVNGMTTLYHYGQSKEDAMILDPDFFLSNTSAHSRKEKEVSMVPRVFFYTDLDKTEVIIAKAYGRNLFHTVVPHSEIYDLKRDPAGFIKQVRHPTFGLRKGIEWDELLNLIKEEYAGVFYSIGEPDLVAWFKPIEVYRVKETEEE